MTEPSRGGGSCVVVIGNYLFVGDCLDKNRRKLDLGILAPDAAPMHISPHHHHHHHKTTAHALVLGAC